MHLKTTKYIGVAVNNNNVFVQRIFHIHVQMRLTEMLLTEQVSF